VINERPQIVATVNIEDGYLARALCLVDGFPAEVRIKIDTHKQKYSDYDISVYDPIRQEWARRVYHLDFDEVGRLPFDGTDATTIAELNRIADLLWRAANVIVTGARLRQEQIETDDHVRNNLALDRARRMRAEGPPEWVAPQVNQGDFALATDPRDEAPYTGSEPEDQG
jgi:hypothetical protein